MVDESPSAREWRKLKSQELQTTLWTSYQEVRDSAAATASAMTGITLRPAMRWLLEQLHACVLDLFSSAARFYEHATGAGDEDSDAFCSSQASIERWLRGHQDYKAWQRASRRVSRALTQAGREQACKDVRKSARRVLLLVHPDKFASAHPRCEYGASDQVHSRSTHTTHLTSHVHYAMLHSPLSGAPHLAQADLRDTNVLSTDGQGVQPRVHICQGRVCRPVMMYALCTLPVMMYASCTVWCGLRL